MSNGIGRQMDLFEIETIRVELKKGPKFFTLQEVADTLKVHYITIYRLVTIGELDASMVAGRRGSLKRRCRLICRSGTPST